MNWSIDFIYWKDVKSLFWIRHVLVSLGRKCYVLLPNRQRMTAWVHHGQNTARRTSAGHTHIWTLLAPRTKTDGASGLALIFTAFLLQPFSDSSFVLSLSLPFLLSEGSAGPSGPVLRPLSVLSQPARWKMLLTYWNARFVLKYKFGLRWQNAHFYEIKKCVACVCEVRVSQSVTVATLSMFRSKWTLEGSMLITCKSIRPPPSLSRSRSQHMGAAPPPAF